MQLTTTFSPKLLGGEGNELEKFCFCFGSFPPGGKGLLAAYLPERIKLQIARTGRIDVRIDLEMGRRRLVIRRDIDRDTAVVLSVKNVVGLDYGRRPILCTRKHPDCNRWLITISWGLVRVEIIDCDQSSSCNPESQRPVEWFDSIDNHWMASQGNDQVTDIPLSR